MGILWSGMRLTTPHCFMASIDLNDAYYVVPIDEILKILLAGVPIPIHMYAKWAFICP